MKDVIKLLDRIGSIGALLAAAAAPCCFPLFAAVVAASGLTLLGRFETTVLYIFQGFALVAITSARRCVFISQKAQFCARLLFMADRC